MPKIGIVGAGWIGGIHALSHIKNPNVGLGNIILADIIEEAREAAAAKFPGLLTVEDYHEILSDPDVVAVDVCTPNKSHKPIACDVLAAGKHALVEKPLAESLSSAKDIIAAAEAYGRQLYMMGNNATNIKVLMLRHLVASGQLGTIRELKASWRRRAGTPFSGLKTFTDRDTAGGGPGYDLMPHCITAAMTIGGWPKPRGLKAWTFSGFGSREVGMGCYGDGKHLPLAEGGTHNVEDRMYTQLWVEGPDGDVPYTLDAAWVVPQKEVEYFQIEVVGSERTAIFTREWTKNDDTTADETIESFGYRDSGGGYWTPDTWDHDPTKEVNSTDHLMGRLVYVATAADTFLGIANPLADYLVGPERALTVMEIIDASYRSADGGNVIML